MIYKVYTLPHCEKCENIKEYLATRNIAFEVIDLGDDDGVAALRKIYVKIKDKVQRTEDGQLPIPLLIAFDNNDVKGVAHTVDEVKTLVS
jgi:glutaredoxin